MFSVMVIVIGNRIGNLSSNPSQNLDITVLSHTVCACIKVNKQAHTNYLCITRTPTFGLRNFKKNILIYNTH